MLFIYLFIYSTIQNYVMMPSPIAHFWIKLTHPQTKPCMEAGTLPKNKEEIFFIGDETLHKIITYSRL